jgi:hypothetical protein
MRRGGYAEDVSCDKERKGEQGYARCATIEESSGRQQDSPQNLISILASCGFQHTLHIDRGSFISIFIDE